MRNAPPTLGRYLSITDDGAGGVRVKGRGSAEDGALIKAALLPLTCPEPGHRRPRRATGAEAPPTRVTTGPGCGTPWSPPPTTPSTPTVPDSHGTPARLLVTIESRQT